MPGCGWEGRDFISALEERWLTSEDAEAEAALGPLESWKTSGLRAIRRGKGDDPARLVPSLRQVLRAMGGAMAEAVEGVDIEDGTIVVRFRPPESLETKSVESRSVECLLY